MANKDYDDLLRSFMNNSSKAYDEDRHAVEKQAQQAPVQRNAAVDRAARHKKEQQMENRLAAKKRKKASKPPKESTPARKLGKVLLGCLMEGNCIIVMMVPLLLTLVKSFGIDLLQFGVMAAINIYIGCITPPVGVSLLLGSKLGKTSIGGTFKAILPFLGISMVILILVTYWPSFTLWLIH